MKTYKGTDRTAYVGEQYTIKVARSNPKQFVKSAQCTKERAGLKGVVSDWKSLTADQHHSLKNFLLHGVVANRRERRLAKQENSVVIPTISILSGLVNVQPTVPSTNLEHRSIHFAFVEHLGSRVTKLGHMLEDISNMGVIDGQVKFIDGGSLGLEGLMQSQPEAIQQALGSLTLQHNAEA